jgi:serine/threonine protein phosphatase 1
VKVVRLSRNTEGRDFVVGDIHGTYSVVAMALQAVKFDWTKDRLFSVGDLVDRGPESPRALSFIKHERIHPIRGNHEDMFLEAYENGIPDEDVLRFWTSRNGMSWWMDLTQQQRMPLVEAFRSLPLVIEVETERGLVGMVHGEVPIGMNWESFKEAIKEGHPAVTKSALWGRSRITHGNNTGVRGIDRVFCGHTIVDGPTRLGNIYFIDSGSFVGVKSGDPAEGRLTMANLLSKTAIFDSRSRVEFHDIRNMPDETGKPFGQYAL